MKTLIRNIVTLGSLSLILGGTSSQVFAASVATSGSSSQDQARITAIKTKGDQEIDRRISSLNNVSKRIATMTKLSASDKATLTTEVTNEINGLSALKTKLDAETTYDGAKADAQSIIQDYRVYALILPKVWLVRTADDQQVSESKLTALITKFQTRINAAKSQGKEVTAIENVLSDMQTQLNSAEAISNAIEQKVISLQPSDYDSDHTILSGDANQLKTAHSDNEAAYADAKTIVSDLKSL